MAKKYLRYIGAGRRHAGGVDWAADNENSVQGVEADVAKELMEEYPDMFEESRASEVWAENVVRSPMGDVRFENPNTGEVGVNETAVAESNVGGGE